MTVSASSSDCATTAIRQLRPPISAPEERDALELGRPAACLSSGIGIFLSEVEILIEAFTLGRDQAPLGDTGS